MAAARVGLDVAVGHAEWRLRRQRDRPRLLGARIGKRLHEAVARFDHAGRAFNPLLGKQGRLHAFARGVTGMQALDVGAAVDEGEQAS